MKKLWRATAEPLEINPEYTKAWNNMGVALSNLGREEEAIECYDRILEIDPGDAVAWMNKGVSIAKLRGYEEAIEHFNVALEICPWDELALKNREIARQLLEEAGEDGQS